MLQNITKPSRFARFWQGAESLAPATRNHSWTFQSGRGMVCFVHFDFDMCFAPQRRANFQKCSEAELFCTFLTLKCASCHNGASQLPKLLWSCGVLYILTSNVLRATTACTFSTAQLPKMLRTCQFLTLLTSNCASRHDGVRFFDISNSKSASTLRCFVHFDFEMCFAHLCATTACNFSSPIWPDGSALASLLFDPREPQIIGKNTVNRHFSTFSRTCIFFLLTLSLLWSSCFFLLFFDSSHLCFSICPYCRKFDF